MARQSVAASVLAAMLLVVGVFASIPTGVRSIGVCYGVHGDRLPSPAEVVQLYRSNGITGMRLYEPDVNTLLALNGSGIGVIMDVADENVPRLASSPSVAADWVKLNIQRYYPGVAFRYIAVGNEITGSATQNIVPAMKNLNAALSSAGLSGAIKVSTAVRMDVLAASSPPSAGTFRDAYMTQVARLLDSTGAPLLANVYPYFAYTGAPQGAIDVNYALFQPSSTIVHDNGHDYTNLFDAMVDALYVALAKVNILSTVQVVISETGWPSAGSASATVANARTYNQNLVDHVRGGTPRRPGKAIEAYLFAMFNENLKTGAESERHFGLFNPDKSPVYPIKF
ncbi:glucan endo-1,3-beta-glucosidase GII isoform X1 [Brachypodium distachyon]|uniref:Uncharacterized protein n=2 Tax=Brachypodium distachyon TaxID=15368 RepID=A0A0Q3GK68_BRADI|nr:glucan endo-1,3-beta-glucosidase GII isoform X1 [Brachypodium distachyon]KQK11495.1 hypothetical protein BRADI_2g60536v3 [Brachypodium distachyon]|eukprot:XP_014755124.1 glucan endo-1,3-beta-glucosidase GII isoform X1 [Brachypodium distachyon]